MPPYEEAAPAAFAERDLRRLQEAVCSIAARAGLLRRGGERTTFPLDPASR
jgi:hypothetical protein